MTNEHNAPVAFAKLAAVLIRQELSWSQRTGATATICGIDTKADAACSSGCTEHGRELVRALVVLCSQGHHLAIEAGLVDLGMAEDDAVQALDKLAPHLQGEMRKAWEQLRR